LQKEDAISIKHFKTSLKRKSDLILLVRRWYSRRCVDQIKINKKDAKNRKGVKVRWKHLEQKQSP